MAVSGVDASVGEAVHRIIWRRRMQQQDVAAAAGMSAATFSRKLRGQNRWTLTELLEVAAYLGVPVVELLPRLDSNQEPAGKRRGAATLGRTPMRLWHVPLAA